MHDDYFYQPQKVNKTKLIKEIEKFYTVNDALNQLGMKELAFSPSIPPHQITKRKPSKKQLEKLAREAVKVRKVYNITKKKVARPQEVPQEVALVQPVRKVYNIQRRNIIDRPVPAKRPVGRPRKVVNPADVIFALPPKKRGRPPKQPIAIPQINIIEEEGQPAENIQGQGRYYRQRY
jgi:hypothetical protein